MWNEIVLFVEGCAGQDAVLECIRRAGAIAEPDGGYHMEFNGAPLEVLDDDEHMPHTLAALPTR